ncbi:NAD(P)/FAD-dependent oxidoreductase [Clostridium sp. JNZ J1-5]
MSKVVVIGGGPAGMMAAISAANKHQVILIEKNEKLGKKLFITGKGRCNVTNSKDISEFFDNIPGNPNFLYSSLYSFTNENTMDFFEKLGVKLKVERGERVFPKSDKSSDIIKAFEKELSNKNVEILLKSKVKKIKFQDKKITSVILEGDKEIYGDYFILATGGLSYPQTGSTGDGLTFSKELGHTIVEPKASLVPIEVNEEWIKNLQGLSLKNVNFSIKDRNNKVLYEEFGEMLFTHYGVSGPIVLSGSRFVNKKNVLKAVINLKPALSSDELDKRIQKDFIKYANKDFKNSLDDLLPQKIIEIVVKLSNIDENKKVNSITKEERKNLVHLLQNFELSIKGLRPIAEAIITAGGINVKEIDPSNMKSKIIENLYFAGEMIDVDAYTGGFNLQIAFSTGYLAGVSIN